MNKKRTLLALLGISTVAVSTVIGVTLSNSNYLYTNAGAGSVSHSISMNTSNTDVSIEDGYISMTTYTEHGNK